MSNRNFFFIDWSSLLWDISTYNKSVKSISTLKLNIEKFIRYFISWEFAPLHSYSYVRFSFYFVKNDERVKELLKLPINKDPHMLDYEIKCCGKRLAKSKKVDDWIVEKSPPNYVMERLNKSEKWVDIQICCDILQLVAIWKVDRVFLYTNDSDFVPLCNTIKSFWCNVSLFRLTKLKVNKDLLAVSDSFSIVKSEELKNIFIWKI